MKHLLLTTIAAVLLMGCGPSVDLHKAAKEGNIEAVKQHLAAGTDVNAKDVFMGMTPLHEAASGGHKEIADLLIANGADVNAKSDWRLATPLNAAISRKHPEIIALLRKHGGKTYGWLAADKFLHAAARVGHIEVVKRHLAAGANVNAKDVSKRTPLHIAAKAGRTEVAELLIAEGADVNAKNKNGDTPLDNAKQQPDLADLLRKHGGKTGEELKAAGN